MATKIASQGLVELCRLQAECCKTFGNPLRLLILECLADRERTFQELLSLTGASKATLSQHTGFMRRHGALVARRVRGRLVLGVASPKIIGAFRLMREVLLERIDQERKLAGKSSRSAPPGCRRAVAAGRALKSR